MEEVYGQADWQVSLNEVGVYEHFACFFDLFPHEGEPFPNEALTDEERAAISSVLSMVREAYDWLTPPQQHETTSDDYIVRTIA